MDLQAIHTSNFQRLGEVDLDLTSHVAHLIVGDNEAGKTSLIEAIRYALFAEVRRVSRKSDYALMVRDGAKAGRVGVVADGRRVLRDIKTAKLADPATGKVPKAKEAAIPEPELPERYRYALDAHRFAALSPIDRRTLLMEVCGARISARVVSEKLQKRGIPNEKIERVLPLLKNGFELAHKEAKNLASQARGQWQSITGENYGSQKADGWKAPVPEFDAKAHAEQKAKAQTRFEEAERTLEAANQDLVRAQIAEQALDCPHCGEPIVVEHHERSGKPFAVKFDPDRPAKALERAKADLTAAQIARAEAQSDLRRLQELEADVELADARTQDAAAAHTEVDHWTQVAEAFAPDGIPGELLADMLKPVNRRLQETAVATGWDPVRIEPDMTLTVAGRPYGLASESAQWRADAALTETLVHASGLGLLVLDRVDVLLADKQIALLQWIDGLARSGEYQRILLLGSARRLPPTPKTIRAHWLANGEVAADEAERQAAAG